MASTIKIKRSGTAPSPAALGAGELAYSWFNDTNKLYIGSGTETGGEAANIHVIGGKFFTDMLDHTPGTLTASSALIVDANSKIDLLNVGNLTLTGSTNTISSTNSNGNIVLDPAGTGYVQVVGTNSLIIPSGTTAQQGPSIAGAIRLNTDTSQFEGYSGTNWGSLGGVKSVDGLTYITPELTPGASDDTLRFYTDGTLKMSLNSNSLDIASSITNVNIDATTVSSSTTTGALVVDGGVGVAGNLNVGGTFSAGAASFTSINNTPIGGTTPSTGAFTQVDVDNIRIDGNTVSATNTNGGITLTPNGVGNITVDSTVASTTTTTGALVVGGGVGVAGNLNVGGAISGGALTVSGITVGTDSLAEVIQDTVYSTLVAGEGIDITYNDGAGTITVDAELASSTNLGVATFNTASFAVASGDVTIKAGGVTNTQLVNSSLTIGSTTVSLGGTSTSLAGLTEVTIDNLNINGNEISSTNANGDIILNPDGTGRIDVSGSRIIGLAEPVLSTDAATKNYVDNAVTGLTWKTSANLLSNTNVALSGSTATLVIDGHAALDDTDNGYRIVLINQTTDTEDGIYVYNDNGTSYTLVRATDSDTFTELKSASVFITEGATYANTGWVQSNHYLTSFAGQAWVQFSGAGAYSAGAGLGQSGTEFFVNVAATGGIEISGDALQLKSTVSGDGLTLTSGVLAVGGTTDRISIGVDSIDIAATYVGQSSITTVGTLTSGALGTGFTTIAVPQGGTGITSATSRGILFGNGTSALGVTAGSATDGSFLKEDSTGNPYWSNLIDGGTY